MRLFIFVSDVFNIDYIVLINFKVVFTIHLDYSRLYQATHHRYFRSKLDDFSSNWLC